MECVESADPAFCQEKLRIQVLLRFTNPTTPNHEYTSHVTTTCLRKMLPSLSAPEPFLWTCVPSPGADQVGRVLDYSFCLHYRIEGLKTPFAFWRYRVNELLAEDDIIPDDQAEIALRQKGYPFPAALRTEQWQQCWLRYWEARKINHITVKPEDRAALQFERTCPDARYAPRPPTMREDYEQLQEDTGYLLKAAFN